MRRVRRYGRMEFANDGKVALVEPGCTERKEHVLETLDGQAVRVVPGAASVTVIWELPSGMRWHRTLECDEATKLGRMLVGASSTARRLAVTGVHG